MISNCHKQTRAFSTGGSIRLPDQKKGNTRRQAAGRGSPLPEPSGEPVSQRRACEVISVDRSSVRYRSVRPDDAIVRVRLQELAAVRRRFGYRRLLILLRREGL
jgi:hypothetical protein